MLHHAPWPWRKLQRRPRISRQKSLKTEFFLEETEKNPARFLPERAPELAAAVNIDLDRPMNEVLAELSKHPVKTRLNLSGTLIVARDIAHAKIKQMIDEENHARLFQKHRFITRDLRKHRRECHQEVLGRRLPGAWIHMSICFRVSADR
jgi:hypothetical protein